MKLMAEPRLETRELGSALEFVLTRNYGLLGNIAGPAVVGGFAFYSLRERSAIAMVFAAAGVIGLVVNWIQGRETVLRVSQIEIVTRGNLASWFTTEMTINVNEVTSVGWSPGGEDDGGGVYVARGWSQTTVLPGATKEHGRLILDAIAEKFPDFPIADKGPASMLFGDDAGITTLGLNKSESQSSGSKQEVSNRL